VLTVLVADDEFAVLEVLAMALEGEGHRVLRAATGIDALRLLGEEAVDVVVCDEQMPRMNGHQLIASMRGNPRWATLPVVMMADTWGRPPPQVDGVVVGKPVMLGELFAQVAAAAGNR
jgi:CheY-like chemotaxis protein